MSVTTCPVLRPTEAEFKDFRRYLMTIDKHFDAGIVKVIPPPNCVFSRSDYEHLNISLPKFYEQNVRMETENGVKGVYSIDIKLRTSHQPIHLSEYKKTLDQSGDIPNARKTEDQSEVWMRREKKFWSTLNRTRGNDFVVKYAGDICMSLFGDAEGAVWNLNRLNSILQTVGQRMGGVTDSMCYIGQYRSLFACHVEDADLYSINYLHYGQPKSWYCVPPSDRLKFEIAAAKIFPEEFAECPSFLRHKNKMFNPEFFKAHNIALHTVVQLPGEYVIPMAGAYHFGFNHGYNIAEATNFATPRWFDIGRSSTHCVCDRDNVYIYPWMINRMETLWLRQRNLSFTSPFVRCNGGSSTATAAAAAASSSTSSVGISSSAVGKRVMRCSCENNDRWDIPTQTWRRKGYMSSLPVPVSASASASASVSAGGADFAGGLLGHSGQATSNPQAQPPSQAAAAAGGGANVNANAKGALDGDHDTKEKEKEKESDKMAGTASDGYVNTCRTFQCVACRLWCHWGCIFQAEPEAEAAKTDADGNFLPSPVATGAATPDATEGHEITVGNLCHECHALEMPAEPMLIMPVVEDKSGRIVFAGAEERDEEGKSEGMRSRMGTFRSLGNSSSSSSSSSSSHSSAASGNHKSNPSSSSSSSFFLAPQPFQLQVYDLVCAPGRLPGKYEITDIVNATHAELRRVKSDGSLKNAKVNKPITVLLTDLVLAATPPLLPLPPPPQQQQQSVVGAEPKGTGAASRWLLEQTQPGGRPPNAAGAGIGIGMGGNPLSAAAAAAAAGTLKKKRKRRRSLDLTYSADVFDDD